MARVIAAKAALRKNMAATVSAAPAWLHVQNRPPLGRSGMRLQMVQEAGEARRPQPAGAFQTSGRAAERELPRVVAPVGAEVGAARELEESGGEVGEGVGDKEEVGQDGSDLRCGATIGRWTLGLGLSCG